MSRDEVKAQVIGVLGDIQQRIPGITCVEITGSTKPLEDIEKFDSKRWPAARTLLAIMLGIPPDTLKGENIFRQGRSAPRTIDQVVDRLCEILCCQTTVLNAA